jgi:hypothetical protein
VILPFVVQVGVLAVLFGGDPGPLPAPWGVSCLTAYPVGVWLALTLANTEDSVQRSVTVVAAGGPGPVAAGTLLAAFVGDLLLTVLSVGWGWATMPHADLATIADGVLAHLAATATGTALGVLCARPFVPRIGWSLLLGWIMVIATAVQSWLPPVGAAIAVLVDGRGPAALVVPVALAVVLTAGGRRDECGGRPSSLTGGWRAEKCRWVLLASAVSGRPGPG